MEIRLEHPDRLSFQSLTYLKKAIDINPLKDDPTLWDILNDCRAGKGEIYIWNLGAMYLEILPEIICLSVLGGENMKEWKDEISTFIKKIMREKNIKQLCILGRAGWHKIFKELKPIGTFYSYDQ